MINPNILYYARLDYDKASASKKTPKYVVTAEAGFYPPMEKLRGRDGRVSMYLLEKLNENGNAPAMRLQAKNSLNFTGLKDYYTNGGKISGFAYGNPLAVEVYGNGDKKTPNPFYGYGADCFLFVVNTGNGTRHNGAVVPDSFELIVIEGGEVLKASYCKQLQMGGFDKELEALRLQACKQ